MIGGFKVIINNWIQPIRITKQIRFPTSKRKRIRNKWSKKTSNFKTFYEDKFIVIDDTIFVNQKQYDHLMSLVVNHPLDLPFLK